VAQRRLDRHGALHARHHGGDDGEELGVQRGGARHVAGEERLGHRREALPHEVPDDTDEAGRTEREQREVHDVVAGVDDEVAPGEHGRRVGDAALGVLVGDDARVLGERSKVSS
jgi:hypothetical protein